VLVIELAQDSRQGAKGDIDVKMVCCTFTTESVQHVSDIVVAVMLLAKRPQHFP
jgi:hypothetical protein